VVAERRRGCVVGASVVGTSHLRNNLHRQDRLDYRNLESALITAVSDGAGSARRSESGAELAVRSAVTTASLQLQRLQKPLNSETLSQVLFQSVQSARQRIEEVARLTDHAMGSYATTLLLAVQTEYLIGAAQIGDGAIVISDGSGEFRTFTYPQTGEYVNQTNFITSSNAMECLDVKVEDRPPQYLAMFTDGIQDLVLVQPCLVPQTSFFSKIFRWLQCQTDKQYVETELTRLLCSPQVSRRTDDDLSLVLTIRK
jgi:hypothetical protein